MIYYSSSRPKLIGAFWFLVCQSFNEVGRPYLILPGLDIDPHTTSPILIVIVSFRRFLISLFSYELFILRFQFQHLNPEIVNCFIFFPNGLIESFFCWTVSFLNKKGKFQQNISKKVHHFFLVYFVNLPEYGNLFLQLFQILSRFHYFPHFIILRNIAAFHQLGFTVELSWGPFSLFLAKILSLLIFFNTALSLSILLLKTNWIFLVLAPFSWFLFFRPAWIVLHHCWRSRVLKKLNFL